MSHKAADPRNKAGNSAMKFVSRLPRSCFQLSPVSCFFCFWNCHVQYCQYRNVTCRANGTEFFGRLPSTVGIRGYTKGEWAGLPLLMRFNVLLQQWISSEVLPAPLLWNNPSEDPFAGQEYQLSSVARHRLEGDGHSTSLAT